ncbi:hypothetical protein SAMN02194393_03738 [Maledivibacter halophilus]|uniref:Uncharacterized protein n=1 Tax=Maledivibacter halophilus TaxID=36842 RepID=A0A1T5M225_9FIRM|nr:hypothetical protein SAMN02194393_03738 [Maledivibacter halophilus]
MSCDSLLVASSRFQVASIRGNLKSIKNMKRTMKKNHSSFLVAYAFNFLITWSMFSAKCCIMLMPSVSSLAFMLPDVPAEPMVQ